MRKYHPDDYLTTMQCAAITGHDRRTILNWIHARKLKAERRGPGTRSAYRVRYGDLQSCSTWIRNAGV